MKTIVDLLRAQPAFISAKAPTAQEVTQAEKALGVTFAADYRDYVAALGVASYEGHELTGVCPFPRLSVVSVTQQERAANPAIPSAWYVLEQTNINDLVIWQDASGAVYQRCRGVRRRKSAQRWRRISRVKMNRKNARSTKCRKSDCKSGVHAV